jgi:heavy metal translocating P-type ATPase
LGKRDGFTVSLLTNSVSIILEEEPEQKELAALEERLASSVRAAGYILILRPEGEKKEKNNEYRTRVCKLIFSVFFTLSVMYLAMGGMIGLPIPPFLVGTENALRMVLCQLALTLPVIILNFHFFRNGFSALLHFAPNMDSLIAVGAGASVIYGLFALFSILLEGENHALLHDLYFESAAMILTLVSFGKLLESRAKDRASDAVKALASLTPRFATVLREGKEISLPIEEIRQGETVLIRAGEMIPVDGTVLDGTGSADESALTGESMPVEKAEGETVRAACVLLHGALTVRADGVGENTSLARMLRLLEDAAASKAPIARIADKVSGVFVPVVMGISLLTFALWMIFSHSLEASLRSAIAVLVISCPCALGLATPTAITVGIGRGAKNGILFRSAAALEKLCSVKTVVFDKTGTVTEGRPTLTDVVAYGEDPRRVLALAAAVEKLSSHPLAQAICRGAEERQMTVPAATSFVETFSIGAQATVDGICYRVGKPAENFFLETEIEKKSNVIKEKQGDIFYFCTESSCVKKDVEELEQSGRTVVLLREGERIIGLLGLADEIRRDATVAVEWLKNAGVTCVMMTGDNERAAALVAKETNLDGFYAGLMPEDKERMVKELNEKGSCAMVGDGINDAPALLRANVGIAVGAGTEVAIDCAGVVLSGSSPMGVADAFALSRATIRIIKQNLFWALFYNAVCIPVAAGLFFPLWGWQLSPMLASAAMSFSSVCVVTNALRLRGVKLPSGEYLNENKNEICNQKEECEMLFSKKTKESQTHVIGVEGMMCPRCVAHVKEALTAVKGVQSVEVSLEAKTATVIAAASVGVDALTAAVTAAGYEVK